MMGGVGWGQIKELKAHMPRPNLHVLTEQCSQDLKGDQLIVLEELHKWEHQTRKVISLAKYGGPVS